MMHELATTDNLEQVRIFDERESNVRSYCRSFPALFTAAKDALIYDVSGRSYIDFLSGAGALNYGHNHDAMKRALIDYVASDGLTHGLDLHTTAKAAFLEEFTTKILKPRRLAHKVQFTGPTGTNAVETTLKLARKVTGRSGIFAFMGGFHGHSFGSLAATSNRYHRSGAGTALTGTTFLPFPRGTAGEIDTLAYLRTVLSDTHSGVDLPAGIIVETVQAEGGVVVAPTTWLQELRMICDDYDILLIVDEVQTGCGRTGPFFSFERADIVPDLVAVSKSISGFGLPMALTLIRPEYDIWEPGEHTGTFRGNQLAFVTATTALSIFTDQKLEARTSANGKTIAKQLDREICRFDRRIVVRGIGMIWGVDTMAIDPTGAFAEKVAGQCFVDGLIIERVGRNDTVLKVLPPLTIDESQLREGISVLANAMRLCLTH